MAPFIQETTSTVNNMASPPVMVKQSARLVEYEPGRTPIEIHENYAYENMMPRFPDVHWPALHEVPYYDRGIDGDEHFRRLLYGARAVQDYNPKIGTEVSGIDLSKLTNPQKDDLARLIATRGVVFFRNQHNFDVEAQRALGQYFGSLHKHATTSVPQQPGLEDVHVVFMEGDKDMRAMFTPTFLWHSDVSLLHSPSTGLSPLDCLAQHNYDKSQLNMSTSLL